MSDTKYLTCAETAKLVRAALKKHFPGQKFSVRSRTYSMGASIDVHWIDGPTQEEVKPITRRFTGSGFDGMIDLKYYIEHWLLPDGSTVIAHSPGTVDNAGANPKIKNDKPHPEAIRVSFGADHVSPSRSYSVERLQAAATLIAGERGISEVPQAVDSPFGAHLMNDTIYVCDDRPLTDWVYEYLRRTSFYEKPEEAEPAAPADGYQVRYDRDWTWIAFAGKPSLEVREALKTLGARWSKRRHAWYIRETMETETIGAAIESCLQPA